MMQWCPDDSKFRLISIRIYICLQDRQLQNQSSYVPDSFSISASLYFHRLLSYPSLICSKIIISFILQSACVSCVLSVETNNRLWFVLFATDMDIDMKCYCCHHIYFSWCEFQTFLCLIYIYLIPLYHTHTNTQTILVITGVQVLLLGSVVWGDDVSVDPLQKTEQELGH